MSDLEDDLTEIQGVGSATADSIIEVLEEGGYLGESETSPYVEKALEAAENGDDREAAVYLRRAGEGE